MKRICVIGCSGAGKSDLSKRLGKATGLAVVHLDRLYWQPGWVALERDELRKRLRPIVAEDAWIIDGNFRWVLEERLQRATTVVILDFSTWRCLWGALSRLLRQRGQVRSDMAEGCPESFDWEFYQWIWRFRRDELAPSLELVEKYPDLEVHRPTNRREADAVFGKLVQG